MPKQPGQEMFENTGTKLHEVRDKIRNEPFRFDASSLRHLVKDESQRIGHVNIPGDFWQNMRQSPLYFLDIPFEERLKHIVQEYGQLDPQKVADAIGRISQKLGNLNAKTAILLLKEGKITESFDILLNYHDKFYFKSLHNREGVNSLLQVIECKSITPENADKLIRQANYHAERS
jgi:tRNA 2-selenouridine synthase